MRLLAKLQHPNIVQLLGSYVFSAPECCFAVFEYADDGDLIEHVQIAPLAGTRRCPTFGRSYTPLCGRHKHGIAHGDLSLDNILVFRNGRAKLADFGQAVQLQRVPPHHSSTHTGVHRSKIDRGPFVQGEDVHGAISASPTPTAADGVELLLTARGKPQYMAPETIVDDKHRPFDARACDVWALGMSSSLC